MKILSSKFKENISSLYLKPLNLITGILKDQSQWKDVVDIE